jgi:hypothetical protein
MWPEEAHEDVFAMCLMRAYVQVCTLTIVYILFCNSNIHTLLRKYLFFYNQQLQSLCMYKFFVTVLLQVFFFRRLKINHESHEFILDSGTVANSMKGMVMGGVGYDRCG